jgi:hypothetical protein
MKLSNLVKYSSTITMGAAMLAACSNSGVSSLAPPGTSSGVPGIAHIGKAVMASKGARPYQYISNFGAADVSVFDYPKSDKQIGSISGVTGAGGECTNALFGTGKKTFWIAGSNGLAEFKVGGSSPILMIPGAFGSCAIDPATGDLAATSSSGVIIFRHARVKGKVYGSGLIEAFFLGYDNKSNLFLDGFNSGGAFALAELPKGSKSFETLTGPSVEFPGAVQFDGKYITVNDQEAHTINGYTCSGTSCTLKQTVSLTGAGDCDQTWIAKGYVICPDAGNNDAEIFKYPAGGSILKTLTGSFSEPLGAVQAEK